MSTPRIGPNTPPLVTPEATTSTQKDPGHVEPATSDRIAGEQPKAVQARTPSTTAGLDTPVEQAETERRARFGGDRGAWLTRTRDGILFAADNPEVGQKLLAAFDRGVA